MKNQRFFTNEFIRFANIVPASKFAGCGQEWGIIMTCKEMEKLIPSFLQDELDTEELREFMEHIEKCEDCREELTIQFLVTEGMARLEEGNVFDLQNELRYCMEEAGHALKRRESMQWLLYGLEGLVAVAVVTLIALLIFL